MPHSNNYLAQKPVALRRWLPRGWRGTSLGMLLGVGSLLTLLSGCAPLLSEVISTAPNRFNPLAGRQTTPQFVNQWRGIDEQLFIPVGPPEATIAVAIIEPQLSAEVPEPRGTVLVLHGIYNRGKSMLSTSRAIASTGYRVILPDLRGHGQSSGKYLTYGDQESRDLVKMLDYLYAQNKISGRLGVYGISYGAATALHLAGRDPRIEAVVAVAPFSNMRDEVPNYIRTALPGLGHLISDSTYDQAVDLAAARIGYDPDKATALRGIQRTRAPILLMHGLDDWLVPPEHSQRLYDVAPQNTELRYVEGLGHMSIWFDPTGEIGSGAREWIDRYVGGVPAVAARPETPPRTDNAPRPETPTWPGISYGSTTHACPDSGNPGY